MTAFSTTFRERRDRNAEVFAKYAVKVTVDGSEKYRTVRAGKKSIFTIGYERRSGEDLIIALQDAGVSTLIDVRDRPFSRKPDFREKALRQICLDSKIDYQSWTDLGSTDDQREKLKATGDFSKFEAAFKKYAERSLSEPIAKLAKLVEDSPKSVALLCYERCHDECHRSILGNLLADRYDLGVVAII